MKEVIIIDDSNTKVSDITTYINRIYPNVPVRVFNYRNPALRHLSQNKKEIREDIDNYLIVLDMCFPLYEGHFPEKDMGLSVLRELERIDLPIKTMVCSSDKQNITDFDFVLGSITYDYSVDLTNAFSEMTKKLNS